MYKNIYTHIAMRIEEHTQKMVHLAAGATDVFRFLNGCAVITVLLDPRTHQPSFKIANDSISFERRCRNL